MFFFEISRKLMGAFSNINHNFFFYNNLEFLKDLKTISKILKLKFKIKLLMGCLIQLMKREN